MDQSDEDMTMRASRISHLVSPVSDFESIPLRSSTGDVRTRLRAISAEIEAFQNGDIDVHVRNAAFQQASILYNEALIAGRYEAAVIYLMIMLVIRKSEKEVADSCTIAKVAQSVLGIILSEYGCCLASCNKNTEK